MTASGSLDVQIFYQLEFETWTDFVTEFQKVRDLNFPKIPIDGKHNCHILPLAQLHPITPSFHRTPRFKPSHLQLANSPIHQPNSRNPNPLPQIAQLDPEISLISLNTVVAVDGIHGLFYDQITFVGDEGFIVVEDELAAAQLGEERLQGQGIGLGLGGFAEFQGQDQGQQFLIAEARVDLDCFINIVAGLRGRQLLVIDLLSFYHQLDLQLQIVSLVLLSNLISIKDRHHRHPKLKQVHLINRLDGSLSDRQDSLVLFFFDQCIAEMQP